MNPIMHDHPKSDPFLHSKELMDAMLLPKRKRETMESFCRAMGMRPGDIHRCIDLALRCARQCLRPTIDFGTEVVHVSGRGGRQIVVGMKPAGYREPLFESRNRRSDHVPDTRWDEPLVWTVDPDSRQPGISQSRLSEWTVASK